MACALMALGAESTQAQVNRYSRGSAARARIQRPTVSPYLNLYRNDLRGVATYQTLVRPQLQQQAINEVQQSEISQLRSQLSTERSERMLSTLPQTGHPSYFRQYSHYYSRKK